LTNKSRKIIDEKINSLYDGKPKKSVRKNQKDIDLLEETFKPKITKKG
jgi:hypothetical protein